MKISDKILFQLLVVSLSLLFLGCKTSKDITVSENESSKKGYIIATYNVRYDNKTDNKEGRSWEERRKHVSSVIKKYDFDIFGVQEPFSNQINDMASDLKAYQRFGVSDDNIPNSTSNHHHDIFYKIAKFNIEEQGGFWLSPGAPNSPPDNLMTAAWGGKAKVCTWGKFRDKHTNTIFYVFNTHFYYDNETTRNNSATIILEKINEIAGKSPVIFMGDLNLNQYSEAYKIINNSTLLNDSYSWAKSTFPFNKPTMHQTFNHWFLSPQQDAKLGHRIDYIFLTKHWKNRVKSSTVIWDNYVKDGIYKMPSDHNAVMVELEGL